MSAFQNHTAIDRDEVSYGYRTVAAADKRRLVGQHFEKIARRYDLADALLSFGLHFLWRRSAIRRLALKRGDNVLDLCGGTADLALRAARSVTPGGTVTVCDISRAMMLEGRQKASRSGYRETVSCVQGDAEMLPLPGNTFDAVTVGFGVRNLVHLERGLREIFRVLKCGGKLMILEFSVPRTGWIRHLYNLYSFSVMPFAGKVVTGSAEPFKYLAESIRVFPAPEALKATLEASGFAHVTFQRLNNGIVVVYLATRIE